ncbi:MAG TPA: NAD(P)H-dependent oxidoreductase [Bacteroidales bacterium]|nr:NAD(P)H-dependent oxidoreductase [Bacteroidales bacterium]
MNILIILGHPDTNSFNHAIAEICDEQLKQNGHQVVFHDLYKENFDPIIETAEIPKHSEIDDVIQQHCNDLVKSDGIIIIHPNWWGQPPAIMKGWIDRVLRPGVAYEFAEGDNGEGTPIGLLKAQVGLVFNTSNTSEYRENNIFKDPLETIWKNCIFDFCGVKKFERKMFRIIVTSDLKQRQAWINETKELIDKYFPKPNYS